MFKIQQIWETRCKFVEAKFETRETQRRNGKIKRKKTIMLYCVRKLRKAGNSNIKRAESGTCTCLDSKLSFRGLEPCPNPTKPEARIVFTITRRGWLRKKLELAEHTHPHRNRRETWDTVPGMWLEGSSSYWPETSKMTCVTSTLKVGKKLRRGHQKE